MTTAYPLYDPAMEHESCGVGAVVDLGGAASHRTVSDALTIVERLAHRAGRDALGTTGDGVGILTQLPHALFEAWAQAQGYDLGGAGNYGVGMLFMPEEMCIRDRISGMDRRRHRDFGAGADVFGAQCGGVPQDVGDGIKHCYNFSTAGFCRR